VTGDLEAYQHLLTHFPGRRIIGITSPGLHDLGKLPDSVEEAAAIGVRDLELLLDDDEPVVLLGFSFGGLLAFECGRQLAALGKTPLFVGLLGTRPPVKRLGKWARLLYLGQRLPQYAWRVLRGRQTVQLPWRSVPSEILRMLGLRRTASVLPGWVRDAIVRMHFRMGERYHPAVSGLPVHLLRELREKDEISLRRYSRYDLDDLGWRDWNDQPVKVHWVDADHADLMTDAVSQVADVLKRQIAVPVTGQHTMGGSATSIRPDRADVEPAPSVTAG
jgi:thioesterase domain-containing protein